MKMHHRKGSTVFTNDPIPGDFLSILYHALRTPRRRYVIHILWQTNIQQITTRNIARQIASQEQGISPEQATGKPYRNVYNALSQTHLPMLAEAGVINYDPQRQTVASGPNLTLAALLIAITQPAIDMLQEGTSDDDDLL
jgi:hypothetical protein